MVKAVILVGGETTGTRFRPLTMDYLKCLFPVAGEPLVSHILSKLVKDLGDQLEEVFFISFFKDPSPFEKYICEHKHKFGGVKITLLTEPTPMGTGGGIYFFRDQILGSTPKSNILFIHGDIVCDYPFKELVEFQQKNAADVGIMGVDPLGLLKDKAYSGLGKEQVLRKFGTAFSSRDTHDIVHYVEKPKSDTFANFSGTNYTISINGGVYIFSPSIFRLLEDAKKKRLLSASSSFPPLLSDDEDDDDRFYPDILSLELDVFKKMPAVDKTKFLAFNYQGPWYQLSTPRLALAANGFFLSANTTHAKAGSLESHSIQSQVSAKGVVIGPNVTVGKNVNIGEGVRLKNCIICDNVSIGAHTLVSNAIVSSGVNIGKWCRVEGTLSAPISQPSEEHASSIISNIVILCKNIKVKSQVFVYNSVVLPHKELRSDIKYEIVM